MEPKFGTSFIPKKTLGVTKKSKRGGAIGIIMLVALIVFLGVFALAVGVFLYQQFLIQSIERKSDSLERARAAFEPSLIQELTRLDARINSTEEILDNHLALTSFFTILENSTLRTVRFDDFRYTVSGADKISVTMKGEARSFSDVALQSDEFGKSNFIQEPVFSNLNLDQKGNVIFNFTAFLNSRLLLYESNLDSEDIQQVEQP